VGLSAAALGKRGLQESLVYAAQRQQGGGQIINYHDVKRMLLLQKAFSEGAFALCVRAACLHDRARGGDTNASALLDLLTEIVKSWPAEWCLEANKNAIQVLAFARAAG
jgi:alkylation response protein AidB-like acyl-CoA dehydrogenase